MSGDPWALFCFPFVLDDNMLAELPSFDGGGVWKVAEGRGGVGSISIRLVCSGVDRSGKGCVVMGDLMTLSRV